MNKLKDLGVIMSSSGRFDDQIEKVVKKVNQMMGWVLRTFKTRDPRPMLALYKAVVLPYLEYCRQVWSPMTLGKCASWTATRLNYSHSLLVNSHSLLD